MQVGFSSSVIIILPCLSLDTNIESALKEQKLPNKADLEVLQKYPMT